MDDMQRTQTHTFQPENLGRRKSLEDVEIDGNMYIKGTLHEHVDCTASQDCGLL